MLSKNQLKYYSGLLQKKNRKLEAKFIVEGPKLILEALNSNFECEIVICTNSYQENNPGLTKELSHYKLHIETVKRNEFEKLADTKNPQEIIGIFLDKKKIFNVQENDFLVALESINDPGNLGTILRNCDWFGMKTIIMNGDCSEVMSPKVIRSSAGSVFHLNIIEDNNFIQTLSGLKENGYEILCADLEGENLYSYKKGSKSVLILANEANGPSEDVLKISTKKINIPKIGKAESLNVASASAVLLAELTKKIPQ